MSQNNKAFCKGVLCRKSDRKYKSCVSGKYVCGDCSVIEQGKVYTIDEYLKSFKVDWDKLNKEFEEMLTTTGVLKNGKTTKECDKIKNKTLS